MIRRLLSRLRGDAVRLERDVVSQVTLDDRIETALRARRVGRMDRQEIARRREAAKVCEQRARDPLTQGLA